jgi:hypothetical protein
MDKKLKFTNKLKF